MRFGINLLLAGAGDRLRGGSSYRKAAGNPVDQRCKYLFGESGSDPSTLL